MRHAVSGRKLSRTKNERRRLLVGLAREMFLRGSITTTLAKAKAVQPMVEKLISRAKVGSSGSLRSIKSTLSDWSATRALLSDVKTRFDKRSSGYTRIVKLGARLGDSTETALLSFVDERVSQQPKQEKTIAEPTKKAPSKKIKTKS